MYAPYCFLYALYASNLRTTQEDQSSGIHTAVDDPAPVPVSPPESKPQDSNSPPEPSINRVSVSGTAGSSSSARERDVHSVRYIAVPRLYMHPQRQLG